MYARMRDIDRMFDTMDLLRNRVNRLFTESGRSYDLRPSLGLAPETPRTNLLETQDHFEIRAEVPGMNREDLSVKIQGNYLEISGTRGSDAPEGFKIHKSERPTGSFSRSFTLPADVDSARAEATLKDGILYLVLPKSEAAKPKKITVG